MADDGTARGGAATSCARAGAATLPARGDGVRRWRASVTCAGGATQDAAPSWGGPGTAPGARHPCTERMWNEFRAFLLKQNALALAIGVVVGGALDSVVKGLVEGFIMPLVQVLLPANTSWQAYTLPGPLPFKLGLIANALLNFAIIGLVAWRLSKLFIKDAPPPAVKACPYCRKGDLDSAASRCPHCTAILDVAALAGVPADGRPVAAGAPLRA
jgi:large conductance mechanosensitive channel